MSFLQLWRTFMFIIVRNDFLITVMYLEKKYIRLAEGLWQKSTRYHSVRCMGQLIFNVDDILVQDKFFVTEME